MLPSRHTGLLVQRLQMLPAITWRSARVQQRNSLTMARATFPDDRPSARSPDIQSDGGEVPTSVGDLRIKLVGPIIVLALWFAGSSTSQLVASVIPPPQSVIAALVAQALTGALALDVAASLWRAVLGIVGATAVAVPLGLVMGTVPLVRRLLMGPIELLRPVSAIAWIPLAILWFGIGIKSVVFVIFIGCVFIVLLNTLAAVSEVDQDLVKAARTLGADRSTIFRKVVIPGALPGILLGIRVALAGAWGGVIVAEMIASQEGIGHMIHWGQTTFRPDLVIGGMVVIGVIGYGLNRIFAVAERRLLPGRG
jgi:NitT/TauT family transport system permease protein